MYPPAFPLQPLGIGRGGSIFGVRLLEAEQEGDVRGLEARLREKPPGCRPADVAEEDLEGSRCAPSSVGPSGLFYLTFGLSDPNARIDGWGAARGSIFTLRRFFFCLNYSFAPVSEYVTLQGNVA